jgi:hypothetical protein
MRTATIRVGAAFLLAAASVAVSQGTANAEPPAPPAPPAPNVKYTLTSGTGVSFNVNYLTAQPPSKEAYNDDPYAFLKKEEVSTAQPWVFETRLDDPQWATIDASAAAHGGQGVPNAHCEIAVDGQVVVTGDGPYTARCQLGNW